MKDLITTFMFVIVMCIGGCATPWKTISTSNTLSLCFSPDGKILASGGMDNIIKLWSVETGQILRPIMGHTGPVDFVFFSSDGKILFSGSADNTIKLWSEDQIKNITNICDSGSGIWPVIALSPDGKMLASGNKALVRRSDEGMRPGVVKLWSVETAQIIKTFNVQESDPIAYVAFSPDGKFLASGDRHVVKLWSIETGQLLKTFKPNLLDGGGYGYMISIAFSPNNEILAAGEGIFLWSIETGEQIKYFGVGRAGRDISCIAFSPNGKVLASGHMDNTVKIWSIETGEQIKTFTGHTNSISCIAFSPDGKFLASGEGEYMIRLQDPINYTINIWRLEDIGIY